MKRIITALIGIPLVIAVIHFAPHWLFALVAAVFAGLAFNELMSFGSARTGSRPGIWTALVSAAVTASFVGNASWVLTILAAAVLFCCANMAFDGSLDTVLPNAGLAMLGLVYCSVLLGFVVWLQSNVVLVMLGTIWTGDAAAYYGGRALGRHKLAPTISPNKTVEGSVAGIVGSIIAGVGLGTWLLGKPILFLIVASLAAAIAGQIGDLTESAFKRSAGVKDSSSLIPGHGGVLDRVDSLLFAAPVFYWFFNS